MVCQDEGTLTIEFIVFDQSITTLRINFYQFKKEMKFPFKDFPQYKIQNQNFSLMY